MEVPTNSIGPMVSPIKLVCRPGFVLPVWQHQIIKDIIFKDLDNAFNNFYTRAYHLSGLVSTQASFTTCSSMPKSPRQPFHPIEKLRFGMTLSPGFGFSTQKMSHRNPPTHRYYLHRYRYHFECHRFKRKASCNGDRYRVMYQAGDKSCVGVEFKYAGWSSYYNDATMKPKEAWAMLWQFDWEVTLGLITRVMLHFGKELL